ncbi:MAG TPA: polyphosphate:AMP phosphotransferase [Opitutaceae bacterium]|nr:polyphosphate:AMP phosphotransferase [Opitutaceae bacterium]
MPKANAGRMSKREYEAHVSKLRAGLVQMQVELQAAPFPVLLVIAGDVAAGKGDVVNILNGWLDPRGVETFGFHEPTDEERERPPMWRYWRCLPPCGRIAIYAGGWEGEALRADPRGREELAQFEETLQRIAHFEDQLVAGGALIVKVWLRLGRAAQADRLRELESEADTAWRVSAADWAGHRAYARLKRHAERMRHVTHRPGAPWHIVESADPRERNLAVGQLVLARFRKHRRAQAGRGGSGRPGRTRPLRVQGLRRLQALRLDQPLSEKEYEARRDKWLGRLNRAVRAAADARRSIAWVFEGWDAAGKGGAIRRLTSAIDARDYRVIPVAKPTDEEKSHHYLWRFWRHVPRDGRVTIYDRSWYGRVLVERLEGFCRDDEWRRAYGELNDFEQQLTGHGTIVLKFWLHLSREEQLRRFRQREEIVYKQHKINAEDWRNRRKWHAYEIAVGDMLALTDRPNAPWHLVPADNKRFARLEILKVSCRQITEALG